MTSLTNNYGNLAWPTDSASQVVAINGEDQMIDTCKYYVPLTTRVRRALQVLQDADHPTVKIYGNHFFVKHPYGLPNIKVYFNLKRVRIPAQAGH